MKKERLDKCLVALGLFETREKAKKAIMAGMVEIDGQIHTKAGDQIPVDLEPAHVKIKGDPLPFVSRGGLKLARGLDVFDFPVKNKTFLDIGASTGGFTDCLLQHGAKKVWAIDVGYGQFDWSLRNDSRVVCMERTNFRYMTLDAIGGTPAWGTVMDVSFISILKLMPAIYALTEEGGKGIWLIKPQFEAGKDHVGKHGVIRDAAIHEAVLNRVTAGITEVGFAVLGLDYSPIRGPKGNIEFLCLTQKQNGAVLNEAIAGKQAVKALVARAHDTLYRKDS